jgi:hypothetical protein
MQYQLIDSRYISDKKVTGSFASNDKQEAILVAKDIGSETVVIRIDERGLRETI